MLYGSDFGWIVEVLSFRRHEMQSIRYYLKQNRRIYIVIFIEHTRPFAFFMIKSKPIMLTCKLASLRAQV